MQLDTIEFYQRMKRLATIAIALCFYRTMAFLRSPDSGGKRGTSISRSPSR
ncbi:MAG TPA: hypothetical protein IGS17_02225 [Oscillatoriales cyanobacterium M59_W2019_021]|nr:hypothetical protein [Oscillatoriales cyanobacterium M4454_W2019_049]HIK49732.1 hypothetical protein [Oscillatoriales cyanobacterium M59_W2019_021]